MNRLLTASYTSLPKSKRLSLLILFRFPPKPGSEIKTKIEMNVGVGNTRTTVLETISSGNDPYNIVEHSVRTYNFAEQMLVDVYVNEERVGSRGF
jgi:hypothetical protein